MSSIDAEIEKLVNDIQDLKIATSRKILVLENKVSVLKTTRRTTVTQGESLLRHFPGI